MECQCESIRSDLIAQLKTKRQEISNHCSRNAKVEEEKLVLKGIAAEHQRVLDQLEADKKELAQKLVDSNKQLEQAESELKSLEVGRDERIRLALHDIEKELTKTVKNIEATKQKFEQEIENQIKERSQIKRLVNEVNDVVGKGEDRPVFDPSLMLMSPIGFSDDDSDDESSRKVKSRSKTPIRSRKLLGPSSIASGKSYLQPAARRPSGASRPSKPAAKKGKFDNKCASSSNSLQPKLFDVLECSDESDI